MSVQSMRKNISSAEFKYNFTKQKTLVEVKKFASGEECENINGMLKYKW